MNKKRLHVVTFQFPLPANYGGVIDVYYKLKALKEQGYFIVLHTFIYDRTLDEAIYEVADEVYLYERRRRRRYLLSAVPFIARSRKNQQLLENLCKDEAPILFEGLHSAYYLSHPALKERVKYFRSHNVEHHYYYHLYTDSESVKDKLFYLLESYKLGKYEKVVRHASSILSISEKERDYFSAKYPQAVCHWVPCFYEQRPLEQEYISKPYLLYHGNLSVEENRKAATHLVNEILPRLQRDIRVVVAGANPCRELVELLHSKRNVTLEANPSAQRMQQLVGEAQVNVLLTFQSTGVKLKLLNALHLGGHCVVNRKMVEGSGLEAYCEVASSDDELVRLITEAWEAPPLDNRMRSQRRERIQAIYSSDKLIQSIER